MHLVIVKIHICVILYLSALDLMFVAEKALELRIVSPLDQSVQSQLRRCIYLPRLYWSIDTAKKYHCSLHHLNLIINF